MYAQVKRWLLLLHSHPELVPGSPWLAWDLYPDCISNKPASQKIYLLSI